MRHGSGDGGKAFDPIRIVHIHADRIQLVTLCILLVEANLIFDPKEYEGGAADAEGEAGDIQRVVYRGPAKAAENDGEVVFEHKFFFATSMPVF